MIEVRNKDIEEAERTLPNVRIGVLVPEGKAQALAQKRDEILNTSARNEDQTWPWVRVNRRFTG
jgi:hypothetical protein